MTTSSFDHRPDTELGNALRDALTVGDDASFVRRAVASADAVFGEPRVDDWWTELGRWSQPGLAAALVVLTAAVLWLGLGRTGVDGAAALGDPLGTAATGLAVPALLASSAAPQVDEVLATALER